MKAFMTPHLAGRFIIGVVLTCCLMAPLAWAQTEAVDPERSVQLRAGMNRAKKEGAKGQLPRAWWDLDSRLDEAEKSGASEAEWVELEQDVERLQNAAAFVARMRKQKSGLEAMLGRFDQALMEIGALYDLETDPVLSGTPAADDLLDRLNATNLSRQILVDSLTVTNRRLNDIVQNKVVYQDSMITALQVEVSSLHQKLWETELRAGVAEADRSAAESVLSSKQQREETIASLQSSFSSAEGEVMLTPDGDIIMRVFGISFGVGSADLKSGQQGLINKVATVIQRFPGAAIRVEGHTDNTGSRDANLRLSRRRAETVARALEQQMDADQESIATEGFGPDRPIALNSTTEGRALNRRIDVVISGGS